MHVLIYVFLFLGFIIFEGRTGAYNNEPQVKNGLGTIEVTVGQEFSYQIPFDVFLDNDTSIVRVVVLTVDGWALPTNSWMTYNEKTQTMYGVPKPRDAGVHQYLLAAKDAISIVARDAFQFNISKRPEIPCYMISKGRSGEWDFKAILQSMDFVECISDVDCHF